ncbi:MAG: N-acetylmuramoyl-L-alanine amidase [Pseudoflavonifractor sp.]
MKKICCLDAGHGPGCVNSSPDGAYKEHEFACEMSTLIRAHLERCGISVVLTRGKSGYPSLAERAEISNKAGADLMVSLHSNACAGTGWHESRGLLIYTSAEGKNAGRNIAANAILDYMRAAGVMLSGSGLQHNPYTVLTKTKAPAVLIEYGFHDNREDAALQLDAGHRAKLAEATAKGICQALGEDWVPGNEPWYRAAQDWAVKRGVSDGTRPEDGATRAEIWEMLRKLEGEK